MYEKNIWIIKGRTACDKSTRSVRRGVSPIFQPILSISSDFDFWNSVHLASKLYSRALYGTSTIPLSQWIYTHNVSAPSSEDLPNWKSQKWWYYAASREILDGILANSSARDSLRLKCQSSSPLAGAWLSCVPSAVFRQDIRDSSFQLLSKYRLGITLLPDSYAGHPCPLCNKALSRGPLHQLCQVIPLGST